ncbi:hypothetical protein [Gordonia sp. CPCC 205333]|uniref:hypothetical protein n=1 Tax=Gordonia sp. CPCC 205333 TaxID=3140790 RepID=UPI003AF3BDBA
MKLATRLALVLIVVCSLAAILAPAAIAAPAGTKISDAWVVRLDSGATRQLAAAQDPISELSDVVFAHDDALPRPVVSATFGLWLTSFFASGTLKHSPAGCVKVAVSDDGVPLTWDLHNHCPWQVSSVSREKVTSSNYGWTAYLPVR